MGTPIHKHLAIFSGFALLLAGSSFAIAQESPSTQATKDAGEQSVPYELQRFEWSQEVKEGQKIIVKNPWGDVRVRQTGDKEAIFHAVMQKIGNKPKVAELKSWTEGDTIHLELIYPEDQIPATPQEGRIDAFVGLPYEASLEIHSDRGKVDTKTLESALTVRAKNAGVKVKSRGHLDISTTGGDVLLTLLGPDAKSKDIADRGRIKTLSGDIEVRYYLDQNIEVAMTSGASKTTNDLALLQNRRVEKRTVHMKKGEQAPKIELLSDTGNIIVNDLSSEHKVIQQQKKS
jgi:DUF4097 and DUF4098 domain-containing protein YvlB